MAQPGLHSDPELVMNSDHDCLGGNLQEEEEEPSWQTVMTSLVRTEAVFMGLVCGVGLIVNILAVCLVLSYWSRLHLSARCAINRAIADILFLFTVAVDVLMHMQDSWTFSSVLCKLRSALAIIGPMVSSMMLMALTGSCFLDVCKPGISFKDCPALLRTLFDVAWSISIIFGIPTFLQSEILKEVTRERVHCVSLPLSVDTAPSQALRLIFMFLVFLVPLVTNWVFIINIFTHKGKNIIPDQPTTSNVVKPRKRHRWRLPLVLSVVFTTCQLPYWIPYLARELLCDADFTDAVLLIFPATMCLPAVNAALNPVFCIYFIKDLLETKAEEEETQKDHEVISLKSLLSKTLEHHTSHVSLK